MESLKNFWTGFQKEVPSIRDPFEEVKYLKNLRLSKSFQLPEFNVFRVLEFYLIMK